MPLTNALNAALPIRVWNPALAAVSIPLLTLVKNEFDEWHKGLSPAWQQWALAHGFCADAGQTLTFSDADGRVALAVVGLQSHDDPWAIAVAAQNLPGGHYHFDPEPTIDEGHQMALGWALANYRFDRYKTEPTPKPERILLLPADTDLNEIVPIIRAIWLVRDMVNMPAEDLGPAELTAAARQIVNQVGGQCREIVGDDLLAENYPAIHAVGRASTRAPRLIDWQWGDPDHPRITLVGKGVCFDTGGLDIKPSSGMLNMKKDMGGAAHALALGWLIATRGLPVRLRVLVPAVDNAIAGNAFRPRDVLKTRKGLTIEVGNTDAEGRLVLADALAEADRESPDILLDFATLTGAARVALGPALPAFFCQDDDLAISLLAQADAVSDPFWRMPLWQEYGKNLSSQVADIGSVSHDGFAGSIMAALFLQKFVSSHTAWGHFDLFAWNPTTKPGRPEGGEAQTLRACYAALVMLYGT
jgi:leucyl aminopeptidase